MSAIKALVSANYSLNMVNISDSWSESCAIQFLVLLVFEIILKVSNNLQIIKLVIMIMLGSENFTRWLIGHEGVRGC